LVFWKDPVAATILQKKCSSIMAAKKNHQWINKYYLIVIAICLALGLMIWLLFRSRLSAIDKREKLKTSISK